MVMLDVNARDIRPIRCAHSIAVAEYTSNLAKRKKGTSTTFVMRNVRKLLEKRQTISRLKGPRQENCSFYADDNISTGSPNIRYPDPLPNTFPIALLNLCPGKASTCFGCRRNLSTFPLTSLTPEQSRGLVVIVL